MARTLSLSVCLGVPVQAEAAPLAQWVWSRADLAPLAAARAVRPEIAAAVQVAEIELDVKTDRLRTHLRLSPSSAERAAAAVIRFNASFHGVWSQTRGVDVAGALADELRRLLGIVRATAPQLRVIQLDYDCPTAQLARWAGVLRELRARGVLDGYEVWITSLVAQLRDPAYGQLFGPIVSGHIVQVFDTGERADESAQAELQRLLARAGMPFGVGIGAFERGQHARARTEHDAFWNVVGALARDARFRGTWVFAAGRPWAERAGSLP